MGVETRLLEKTKGGLLSEPASDLRCRCVCTCTCVHFVTDRLPSVVTVLHSSGTDCELL